MDVYNDDARWITLWISYEDTEGNFLQHLLVYQTTV